MASLDNLEGDLLEGIGALVSIALIVLIIWTIYLYFKAKNANLNFISTGFNNFAGNFSNGLYDVGAPSFVANPLNSGLSHISEWLSDVFYSPAKANTDSQQYSDSADETISLGSLIGGN
jgi:hypothetical protein